MAAVGIALVTMQSRDDRRRGVHVPYSRPLAAETINSSAASQQSTAVVGSNAGADIMWEITAHSAAVWAAFGANPTAVAGTHFLVPIGTTRYFGAKGGDKVAIVNA